MIAQKNLDLGRIGDRNGPDPWFFGQSFAQAWFPFQGGLLHDDWAKKPWIWAVSAFETAQIQGLLAQSLAQAWWRRSTA